MQPTSHTRVARVTVLLLGLAAMSATALPVAHAAPGTTERVSVANDGTQADNISGRRGAPSSSADGRLVAFDSLASNLVAGDTNAFDDIFVRDRAIGTTQRVSVSSSGAQGNGASGGSGATNDVATIAPAISADGRFVVFASAATNLVAGDTNSADDVFVRDRQAGTTQRVSVSSSGAEGDGGSPSNGIRGGIRFGPAISGDGRFVVFDSQATNLVPGDTNTCGDFFPNAGTCPDVFVHDLTTGSTARVSIDSSGAQANGASTDPGISADGTTVVFFSAASNLVAGDTNSCSFPAANFPNCPDIFAHTG
jgi:Tol biopolymer transport system component